MNVKVISESANFYGQWLLVRKL